MAEKKKLHHTRVVRVMRLVFNYLFLFHRHITQSLGVYLFYTGTETVTGLHFLRSQTSTTTSKFHREIEIETEVEDSVFVNRELGFHHAPLSTMEGNSSRPNLKRPFFEDADDDNLDSSNKPSA